MSSQAELESALTGLLQNNYTTLAVLTAVGYDYILTLVNEIEYIWTKPWTWVSTLYLLVRYVGFYTLAVPILLGSSFLPGPVKTCQILYSINGWAFLFFFDAANFVMILRVWVMYNRSRLILGILLLLYSVEFTSTVIAAVVGSNPKNLPTAFIQILNYSLCFVEPTPRIWTTVVTVLQIVHSGAVCTLAIIQFVRQSFQMYRARKQWQINQYMSLLVQQGILYFLAIFLFTLMNALAAAGKLGSGLPQLILSVIAEFVPMWTLIPRFIISVRELYARDTSRVNREGIDTGFGLSSGRGVGEKGMVFADVEQNEGAEDIEETQRAIEEISRDIGTTPNR